MDNAAVAAAKPLSGFSYSDVNRLHIITAQGKEGIRAAAQQFESLFIDMVLTSMRQASSAFADNDYMSSDATRMQQEMLDHQWAVHIAENGGVGLADVIVKQMSGVLEAKHPKVAAPAMPIDATPTVMTSVAADALSSIVPDAVTPVSAGNDNVGEFGPIVFPVSPPDVIVRIDPVMSADAEQSLDEQPLKVTAMGNKDGAFDSPADFVAKVLPVLEKTLLGTGLNPLLVLAQGALETGWGAHVIHTVAGDSSHNLFNIKASADWTGPAVEVSTVEFYGGKPVRQRDRFRAYESVEAAVGDYLSFLNGNTRYKPALAVAQDPARFADALHKAGYATDPDYAGKIMRVLTGSALRAAIASLRD